MGAREKLGSRLLHFNLTPRLGVTPRASLHLFRMANRLTDWPTTMESEEGRVISRSQPL